MKSPKEKIQKSKLNGSGIIKKMLDDKKAISDHLSNGGKLSDLKDKFKFVSPL
jgi:hypothetical protein